MAHNWHLFIPKSITVLREGYGWHDFRCDVLSGVTVAIVALPLAMALAIASGVDPERGLYTAVVAGFLISLLGGSRFQIGGPTGAFVVVVFDVVQKFGYEGLAFATLMAGVMLVIAGFARLGTYIKYIPYPVVTGFTAGIAVIIFSSQVKDLFGLRMVSVPSEFFEKWAAYGTHISTVNGQTFAVSGATLLIIIMARKYFPRWPAFLIGVTVATVGVWALGLGPETIGQRFGAIPSTLPAPHLPDLGELSFDRVSALLPSAFTIAFLAGVESLLSAVVADGMTGRRHRSNCELVAQGVANIGSVILGGIPATGAIARTATNIRSGARSPISGMLHSVFLLAFMYTLAPILGYIPLAALGAVLTVVAWNMSEYRHFIRLMSAPIGDRVVLLLTFTLTVVVDLTIAIEVGVVLACFLFMHRMSQAVEIETNTRLIEDDQDDLGTDKRPAYERAKELPDGAEAYAINGPFFFGAASRVCEVLERIGPTPKALILRMRNVPMIDTTGASALQKIVRQYQRLGTHVILSGVRPQPHGAITEMFRKDGTIVEFASDFLDACRLARQKIDQETDSRPKAV